VTTRRRPGTTRTSGATAAPTTTYELLRGLVARFERRQTQLWAELEFNANERLFVLHLLEGPVGVVQLASWIGITTAAATVMAGRLERRGLVVRQPHPTDRRRVLLYPSKQLLVHYRDRLEPLEAELEAITRQLEPAQRVGFGGLIEELGVALHPPVDPVGR
jgi:DNA-binding MarR family transcriptional regulator